MSLYFEKFQHGYLVKGNTYRHKEFLKQNGGSWNRYEKGWFFKSKNPIVTNYISNLNGEKKDVNKDELEEDVNEDINEDELEEDVNEDELEEENLTMFQYRWLMIVSVIFGIGLGIIWNG